MIFRGFWHNKDVLCIKEAYMNTKLNSIFLIGLVATLTGCTVYQPMVDRTYVVEPKKTSPQNQGTVYYNSKGEAYQYNNSGDFEKLIKPTNEPKEPISYIPAQQPQVVYQQSPQIIYQQAPQVIYQPAPQVYYEPAPVYYQQQPQVVYQNYPRYRTAPNIGGALVGGVAGAALGSALTRDSYYVPRHGYRGRHGGYHRSYGHGNVAAIGLGAAAGTIVGAGCPNVGGSIIGSVVGGLIGSQIGKGSGRAVATAIGAGTGAVVGGC